MTDDERSTPLIIGQAHGVSFHQPARYRHARHDKEKWLEWMDAVASSA